MVFVHEGAAGEESKPKILDHCFDDFNDNQG